MSTAELNKKYEKSDYSVIGTDQPVVDARDKVTGKAVYVTDVTMQGMLLGKALRSPYPHAKILSVDTSRAKNVPGVVSVITGKEVVQNKWGPVTKDEYLLAVDRVRFCGDEVAAVAAVDEDALEEALSLIKVEYEPLPAILDMRDAMKEGAPQIHDESPLNINHHFKITRGNVDETFASAHLVHEGEYSTDLNYQGYIEPMGGVSVWDQNGNVTIYAGIQTPTWSRRDYAVALGIPAEKMRIVQPLFGGGFGAKLSQPVHPLGALLSKYAKRPVRLCLSRHEDFQAGLPRLPMRFKLRTAWSKDGKYLGKDVYILADQGAYASYGAPITLTAMYRIDIMYQTQVLQSEAHLVYTNKIPTGCYRGFGNAQKHFAHETHLDEVANILNIDPAELRLKNCAYEGYVNPHGWKVNSIELRSCIEKSLAASDFSEKRRKFFAFNKNDENKIKRGIGFSPCIHVSGNRSFIKDFEGAAVLLRMNEQGRVYVYANEPDMGQGIRTVLTMCAAEGLELDFDRIVVPSPDTDIVPFGLGCFASRGTYMATGAMKVALDDMRQKLIVQASKMLGVPEAELKISKGSVVKKGDESSALPYERIAWQHVCDVPGQHILGIGHFTPDDVDYPDEKKYNNISGGYAFGSHVAEVEVNVDTGQVKLVNLWGIHDVGQAINLMAVKGQIQGGMAQAYGWTLMEKMQYNDKGVMINPTFLDYQMPTAADIPHIHADVADCFEWSTGFGAKSIGECSFNGTAPAIQNAIYNAVGVRINELPITAEKVLAAIKEKGEAK